MKKTAVLLSAILLLCACASPPDVAPQSVKALPAWCVVAIESALAQAPQAEGSAESAWAHESYMQGAVPGECGGTVSPTHP